MRRRFDGGDVAFWGCGALVILAFTGLAGAIIYFIVQAGNALVALAG